MLVIVSEVELRPASTDAEKVAAMSPVMIERATGVVRALLADRAGGVERAGVGRSATDARTRWPRRSMDNTLGRSSPAKSGGPRRSA
jgi:hypothetical protein